MSEQNKQWLNYAAHLTLIPILALAFKLRTLDMNRGFWQDEAFEYNMTAARPLWDVIQFQPFPILHITSYFSLYLADEEWAMRVPSLLFGLFGIVALYVLASKYLGKVLGLSAGLLLTILPFHVYSSSEQRFYALTALAGILILYTLDKALNSNKRKDWIWFILAGNFGAMSQATVIPLIFGMAAGASVWIYIQLKSDGYKAITKRIVTLTTCVFLAMTGVVICSLTGEYGLFRNLATDSQMLNGVLVEGDIPFEIIHYRLGVLEYILFYPEYFQNFGIKFGSVFFVLCVIGSFYLYKKSSALVLTLIAAILITPIPFFIIDTTHWYHPRYFCSVVPFVLLLVCAGLAAVIEAISLKLKHWTKDSISGVYIGLIQGVVLCIFIAYYSLAIISTFLDPASMEDGLHKFRDKKVAIGMIREDAPPTAMVCSTYLLPDWYFYERKHLASYLIEPVQNQEPFDIYYLSMRGSADVNVIPAGSAFLPALEHEELGTNKILHFEQTPTQLRSLPGLSQFSLKNTSETGLEITQDQQSTTELKFPIKATLTNNGAYFRYASKRIRVMPHRYVEWIAELNGPPQFGMLMNFYDHSGNLLLSESRWMRDTGAARAYEYSGIYGEDERVVAQCEPHPTGATPPMAPIDGDFKLKLSCATPPCAAYMETQLLVRGDTRAEDVYIFKSSLAQGNWGKDEQFVEFSPFNTTEDTSFKQWTIETTSGKAPSELVQRDQGIEILTTPELSGDENFEIISNEYTVGETTSIQIEIEFSGNFELMSPRFQFFTEGNTSPESRVLNPRVDQPFQPNRPSMVIVPIDENWSKMTGTVWVPHGANRFSFGLHSNSQIELENDNRHIKLKLPLISIESKLIP